MKKNLLMVPRWSGTPRHDWYDWMEAQLKADPLLQPLAIQTGDMPDPSEPRLDSWPDKILEMLGNDPEKLRQTLLVGHSVGCQAVLHALEKLQPGCTVGAVLCVAGWWDVDNPWPSIRPWIDAKLDLVKIRASALSFTATLSDNDPFTADWETNKKLWEERLAAKVFVFKGCKHFNDAQQPQLLQTIRDLLLS